MAKEKFERVKFHMNVGTMGHVDHGKTTLTAAITHVASLLDSSSNTPKAFDEIDNAPEESKRGITISASHIEYSTPKRHYSHVDLPGHNDYTKNMITGASLTEALILVVSAYDGAMQQTKEHVLLAVQIGVKNIVVFLNKVDMVDDPDMVELVKEEIFELLEKNGYDPEKVPFIQGSGKKALDAAIAKKPAGSSEYKCIEELLEALDNIPEPKREVDKPFLLSIEDVFSIEGRGTVATGLIEKGKIKVGESVDIVGIRPTRTTTVTGVEMFKKELDSGQAGDNVGVLLRGIAKTDICRGQVLCFPGSVKPYTKIKTRVYILSADEGGRSTPFFNKYRPQIYKGTSDTTGSITIDPSENKEMVMPGEHVVLIIELIHPIAILVNDKFTIREGGKTVGAGTILEILE